MTEEDLISLADKMAREMVDEIANKPDFLSDGQLDEMEARLSYSIMDMFREYMKPERL